MRVDNYTIFSDGTSAKEETDDETNTYTYYNLDTNKETDLGTYDKVENGCGEDMVKVGDGGSSENDLFQWNNITSGNLYFNEDAFAGILGGIQSFYDEVGTNVEKVQFNQFMSLDRVHSNKGDRRYSFDLAYYNNDGSVSGFASNKIIAMTLNTKLYNSFKDFGLGSRAVYTSTSRTGRTKYIEGTTGLTGHHHHFHFEGFNGMVWDYPK